VAELPGIAYAGLAGKKEAVVRWPDGVVAVTGCCGPARASERGSVGNRMRRHDGGGCGPCIPRAGSGEELRVSLELSSRWRNGISLMDLAGTQALKAPFAVGLTGSCWMPQMDSCGDGGLLRCDSHSPWTRGGMGTHHTGASASYAATLAASPSDRLGLSSPSALRANRFSIPMVKPSPARAGSTPAAPSSTKGCPSVDLW